MALERGHNCCSSIWVRWEKKVELASRLAVIYFWFIPVYSHVIPAFRLICLPLYYHNPPASPFIIRYGYFVSHRTHIPKLD